MQIKGKYSWVKHLDFMLIDLGALLLAFVLAYYLKFGIREMNVEWRRFAVILAMLNLLIDFVANPYSGIFRRRYYHEIGRALLIVAANALCAVLIFYVMKVGASYSREVFIDTYVFYFFIAVVLKYIWKKLLISGKIRVHSVKKRSLFLISRGENAEKDIHSVFATDLMLYDIKGVHLVAGRTEEPASACGQPPHGISDVPVVGDEFVKFILENKIDEVLICVPLEMLDRGAYQRLVANGVAVNMSVEALLGFQTEEQFVSNVGVNKVLSVGAFSFSPSQRSYLVIKRFFDILCGLLGLILLIPVTAFVKLAYLLSGDRAKIFYRQRRVGLNGKVIRIWKYRSMVPDAAERLQELLKDENYRREWDENQKLEKDPRITRVGAFLRRTSIDELPQLLNVLRGDMSLVGPRPLVEGELAAHNGLILYEKVKPGITGWWGCNGRSNIDYHERLELEYYYVKNCSLYLDVLCIIRTVFAVLEKDGAL